MKDGHNFKLIHRMKGKSDVLMDSHVENFSQIERATPNIKNKFFERA